jgi:hypothetical protein
MAILHKSKRFLSTLTESISSGFDIRDIFIFGWMAMLFYGLNIQWPWIAFTVCGVLLMLIGYLMRGSK